MTTPGFLTDPALGMVWDALPNARVVGGAVRDALANRSSAGSVPADIDLATPEPPDAVMTALTRTGVKVVPTGLAHGTITAVVDGRGFEVTTLRRDVETDGRHAVVAFTADWRQDAARRDFTINAMSVTRDGSLFDYFGGAADLAAGRLRFVGDPATRIAEDHLRILRYFRFYARYASVPPDAATMDALKGGIPGLGRLSVERVWNELRRILAAPDPTQSIHLMDRLGIWAAVVPEASANVALARLPTDPILRLAAMIRGDPLALAQRLRMSVEDRDRLLRLMSVPHPSGSDADLRRLLADHLPGDLIDRAWLDHDPDVRHRLSVMPRPVFPLEGRDVLGLGISPGPVVGTLLRDVRQWWMDRGCTPDRAACLMELARSANLPKMSDQR